MTFRGCAKSIASLQLCALCLHCTASPGATVSTTAEQAAVVEVTPLVGSNVAETFKKIVTHAGGKLEAHHQQVYDVLRRLSGSEPRSLNELKQLWPQFMVIAFEAPFLLRRGLGISDTSVASLERATRAVIALQGAAERHRYTERLAGKNLNLAEQHALASILAYTKLYIENGLVCAIYVDGKSCGGPQEVGKFTFRTLAALRGTNL